MTARQIDLFDHTRTVDTRNRRQRKQARISNGPKQVEMFSQREMAQFGVRANPKIDISPKTRIELMVQDLRSTADKEASAKKQIQDRTYPLL